jgi:hypothetical protein
LDLKFKAFTRQQNHVLVFLCETKIQPRVLSNTLNRLGFRLFCQSPPDGLRGGLALAWRMGVEFEPTSISSHHISGLIYANPPHQPWLLSCVYCPSTWQDKQSFWTANIGHSFAGPWLIMGDLNAIASPSEKIGGIPFAHPPKILFLLSSIPTD